jgi:hypothetical protein
MEGVPRVADPRLDRMLSALDAEFDAAVAREEEEAADDLAFSLSQGLSLGDVLPRGAWILCGDSLPAAPVAFAGRDFVAAAEPALLVPAAVACLRRDRAGFPPAAVDAGIVEVLRVLARRAAMVRLESIGTTIEGRIRRVGPDHISIHRPTDEFVIALGAVRSLWLAEGNWDGAI